jgi:hypothetical protein
VQGNASFEWRRVIKFVKETLLLKKSTDVVEVIFCNCPEGVAASERTRGVQEILESGDGVHQVQIG